MRSGDSKRRIKARTFASTYLNPMPTRKRMVSRVAVIPRAPIFGRYKIHFWDERHGLFPFLGSLGVSSVILLAINYAVLSSSIPGPHPLTFSLSPFPSSRNLPRLEYPSGWSRLGLPDDISPKIFAGECLVSWHIYLYPPSDVEGSRAGILTLKFCARLFPNIQSLIAFLYTPSCSRGALSYFHCMRREGYLLALI